MHIKGCRDITARICWTVSTKDTERKNENVNLSSHCNKGVMQ